MSIDWGSILSTGLLETIPVISRVFTSPFILSLTICSILGGLIFRSKEGSTIGAFVGLIVASSIN